jgi:hypothetical protein
MERTDPLTSYTAEMTPNLRQWTQDRPRLARERVSNNIPRLLTPRDEDDVNSLKSMVLDELSDEDDTGGGGGGGPWAEGASPPPSLSTLLRTFGDRREVLLAALTALMLAGLLFLLLSVISLPDSRKSPFLAKHHEIVVGAWMFPCVWLAVQLLRCCLPVWRNHFRAFSGTIVATAVSTTVQIARMAKGDQTPAESLRMLSLILLLSPVALSAALQLYFIEVRGYGLCYRKGKKRQAAKADFAAAAPAGGGGEGAFFEPRAEATPRSSPALSTASSNLTSALRNSGIPDAHQFSKYFIGDRAEKREVERRDSFFAQPLQATSSVNFLMDDVSERQQEDSPPPPPPPPPPLSPLVEVTRVDQGGRNPRCTNNLAMLFVFPLPLACVVAAQGFSHHTDQLVLVGVAILFPISVTASLALGVLCKAHSPWRRTRWWVLVGCLSFGSIVALAVLFSKWIDTRQLSSDEEMADSLQWDLWTTILSFALFHLLLHGTLQMKVLHDIFPDAEGEQGTL